MLWLKGGPAYKQSLSEGPCTLVDASYTILTFDVALSRRMQDDVANSVPSLVELPQQSPSLVGPG